MSRNQQTLIKWIIAEKLAGSPFPLSREVLTLPELKIKLVINLTSRGISNRVKEQLKQRGVKWERLAIPDFGVPEPIIIKKFLQSVCEAIQREQAVLTHCIAGCGRTGTMIGLFLVTHGYSPAEALDVIHGKLGEGCPETQRQLELIHQYRKKCPNYSLCKGKV